MNKVIDTADLAVADVHDGATIMFGGFGLCGIPENLIAALVRKGVKNLHTIANNVGIDGYGTGSLLDAGQIASHTGSYVGENKLLEKLVLAGALPLKLLPQGTLAEAIRAGGAGIPGFFTPTCLGTGVAEGKEAREFDGRQYILERALTADFAIIKAWKGDRLGNLVYRKASRNFNPDHGDGRRDYHRRGGETRGTRRDRSRSHRHSRHLRSSPGRGRPLRKTH